MIRGRLSFRSFIVVHGQVKVKVRVQGKSMFVLQVTFQA